MDASRNIRQAPADSPALPLQNQISNISDPFVALRIAARALAKGCINRRSSGTLGSGSREDFFCIECRLVQVLAQIISILHGAILPGVADAG